MDTKVALLALAILVPSVSSPVLGSASAADLEV